jgi:hypothetical protein
MPAFAETRTLKSLEIIPALDIINVRWEIVTTKDGVPINAAQDHVSYSNEHIADFEIEIAPTGDTLANIVAGFSEAAVRARDDLQVRLPALQAENESLKAQIAQLQGTQPSTTDTVTMRQARLALLQQGHYATIQAAMSMQSEAAKIEWEYATTVTRDSVLTQAMIAVLGLSATDADDLFILAGGL